VSGRENEKKKRARQSPKQRGALRRNFEDKRGAILSTKKGEKKKRIEEKSRTRLGNEEKTEGAIEGAPPVIKKSASTLRQKKTRRETKIQQDLDKLKAGDSRTRGTRVERVHDLVRRKSSQKN